MSTVETKADPKSRSDLWSAAKSLQARYPLLQVAALILIFIYASSTLEGFSSWISVKSILVLASLIGLAAVGQTLVVILGGFDLSVPGFIVAGALVVTELTEKYQLAFGVALIILILGAAILGAVSGWLSHKFEVPPLIVTLAMGAIAIGIVQVQVPSGLLTGTAPSWLIDITSPASRTFGIDVPPVVGIWLAVIVLVALLLSRTVIGRRVYYAGDNARAADLALVRTRSMWTMVFAFSGVCSALVGVLLVGYAGSVNVTLGAPYLFQGLAAVIVGGTVFGGPGSYNRTVVGALLLTVLNSTLVGHGFTSADQQILAGAIILAAVSSYGRERHLRDRV